MRFGGLFRERSFHQSRAARTAYRGLRRGASKVGFDVVLKTFYSPIPDLDTLPEDAFTRTSELPGIDFDLERQLQFVRDRLGPAMKEFHAQVGGNPADRWAYGPNGSYRGGDATVLYAMVRGLRPGRIVELGSGYSTLAAAQAARANADEGHPVTLEAYDPFPSVVAPELPGLTRLDKLLAQQVPLEVFESLRSGDILFVDTTHTVKVGSDVNFIVLEVLPRLKEGVIVHLHDIFLPYEYPRPWFEDYGLYWTEQYLVQAFLAFSSGYEVLAAMHALQRERRDALADLLPPDWVDLPGGAFWMRRTGS